MKKFEVGETVLVEAVIDDTYPGNEKYNVRLKGYETESFRIDTVYPLPTATKTYEDGLNEAWEIAKRINLNEDDGGLSTQSLSEIFDTYSSSRILLENGPEEAAAKIKAWENEEKIKQDDVVAGNFGQIGLVTKSEDGRIFVTWEDGSNGEYDVKTLIKTGHTLNIGELLKKMNKTGGEKEEK